MFAVTFISMSLFVKHNGTIASIGFYGATYIPLLLLLLIDLGENRPIVVSFGDVLPHCALFAPTPILFIAIAFLMNAPLASRGARCPDHVTCAPNARSLPTQTQ